MKFGWPLVALLVILPLSAHAAGFAKQSLFISKTPVTEGDVVLIHAVVANDNVSTFKGEVVFKDGDSKVGTVAVSITAGGANAVSVSWKPLAGTHTIVAELTDPNGTVVESESDTFTVDKKPEPAEDTSATDSGTDAVESSAHIQDTLGSYSPAVASATEPVFSVIDSARATIANKLDQGIEWAKVKTGVKKPGQVLGSATESTSPSGFMETMWFVLATITLYALTIARFIVGSAGIFYPVLAILFLYMLWRLFKRFRRPRY